MSQPSRAEDPQAASDRVVVPHTSLSAETLDALVEEFVTREGTDYGLHEFSLESKKASVLQQLVRGLVAILFDPASESVTIVRREELPRA